MFNRDLLSFTRIFSIATVLGLSGMLPLAQAGQIPGDPDGWDRENVNVRIFDVDGNLVDSVVWPDIDYSLIPADGSYQSDIYDNIYIDGASGETLMTTLVAKDPPVGIPPGLKVLNEQVVEPSQPENCIMATAVGITCGSGFQTHKRFKALMQPTMVDGGTDSYDLVFDATTAGNDPIEAYRVFQKINNWTGQRLTGFRLELGFGVGAAFQNAAGTAAAANLTVDVDDQFTDPDKQTNFAHGLFGPIEPPNWGDTGAFTGGFFDDQTRAGYRIQEVDSATYESIPDVTTGGIFGKYEDVLPEDPNSAAGLAGFGQFGPWIPTAFLPQGVFFDDDDNPNTDDTLMAWWGYNTNCATAPTPVNTGNYCWMYGDSNYYAWIDNQDPALGFVKDVITENYQPVSQATFTAWGADSRYYVDTIDDLANLNLNYVVHVGTVDATWPTWDGVSAANFTVRVTPVQDVNVANRTAAPGYTGTPHIPLFNADDVGSVEIRPSPEFVPVADTLTMSVTDAGLNVDANVADTVDVVLDNLTTNETETGVTLTETGIDTGVFTGTLPTGLGPSDGDNTGTIFAQPGESVQVTYIDTNPAATLTASTTAVTAYDGSVQFLAEVNPNSDILIQVDDLDLTGPEITVTVVNQATGESETVTLFQSLIAGQYVGSLSSTDVAGSGNDDGTLSVAVGDTLQVTYIDAVAQDGSLNVARTDQVTVTAAPSTDSGSNGSNGGLCSLGDPNASFNPTMPLLLALVIALGLRNHRRQR